MAKTKTVKKTESAKKPIPASKTQSLVKKVSSKLGAIAKAAMKSQNKVAPKLAAAERKGAKQIVQTAKKTSVKDDAKKLSPTASKANEQKKTKTVKASASKAVAVKTTLTQVTVTQQVEAYAYDTMSKLGSSTSREMQGATRTSPGAEAPKKPRRGPKLHFANVAKAAAKRQAAKEEAARAKLIEAQGGAKANASATLRSPLTAVKAQGNSSTAKASGGKKTKAATGQQPSNIFDRLYYIKNWKRIKRKEAIIQEGKLDAFILELLSKYPDKFVEAIKQDLEEETAFAKVIYDLELEDRDDEVDGSMAESDADEPSIDSLKREFEDVESDF